MCRPVLFLLVVLLLTHPSAFAAADPMGIRGPSPLLSDPRPAPIPGEDTGHDLRPRSSHDQPPIIPHSILNYRIDISTNECLSCHGHAGASESPLTIAHFLDRGGRSLAAVAAGHYFCTQCHVSQAEVPPPVGNSYQILVTIPFQRHICTECHLPQIGISDNRSTLRGGDEHAR